VVLALVGGIEWSTMTASKAWMGKRGKMAVVVMDLECIGCRWWLGHGGGDEEDEREVDGIDYLSPIKQQRNTKSKIRQRKRKHRGSTTSKQSPHNQGTQDLT